MTIALVQTVPRDFATTGLTAGLSYASNVGSGNLLVAFTRQSSNTSTVVSVIGLTNGAFTKAVGPIRNASLPGTIYMYYKENSTSGGDTITATWSASNNVDISLYEFSGIATSGSLDQIGSGGTGNGTPGMGTITPTTGQDTLIICGFSNNGSEGSFGTNYTGVNVANSNWYDYEQYRIITSPNTGYATSLAAATVDYCGAAACFKAAGGSPPTLYLKDMIGDFIIPIKR